MRSCRFQEGNLRLVMEKASVRDCFSNKTKLESCLAERGWSREMGLYDLRVFPSNVNHSVVLQNPAPGPQTFGGLDACVDVDFAGASWCLWPHSRPCVLCGLHLIPVTCLFLFTWSVFCHQKPLRPAAGAMVPAEHTECISSM